MQAIDTLLKPIEKQTLAKTVQDRLLLVVRNGDIPPGQALPSQHELARLLAVSRPVLREAMQALAATGAAEIRPGSGWYVRNPHGVSESDEWFEMFALDGEIEVL